MRTIASSALTFLDTTDHNQLSAYLSSNFSTVQTCTSNGQVYNPSWSEQTPLKIQLHAFFNQMEIDYKDKGYTISWYVKDGNDDRKLIDGAKTNELTVNTNALGTSVSGMLTYMCVVQLDEINIVESQITYTLIGEAKGVVFSIYTPNGNIFLNQSGTLKLATNKYYGPNEITSGATFQWYVYQNTNWVAIAGATTDNLEVNGSDVLNVASYKCVMKYNSVDYVGVITLQDKSDPYISEIYTVGGTVFKNGVGGSAAYVIVRANGKEVDELVGPISTTAPPSPAKNSYWYCVDNANNTVTLKQYSGSTWATIAGDPQEFNYTWSLMNKDGQDIKFSNNSETKRGKVIYVSCSDIQDTGTVQCDISRK